MRKYFFGFSVQVIATVDGIPVEFAMLPGCYHDIDGMKNMFFRFFHFVLRCRIAILVLISGSNRTA